MKNDKNIILSPSKKYNIKPLISICDLWQKKTLESQTYVRFYYCHTTCLILHVLAFYILLDSIPPYTAGLLAVYGVEAWKF